MGNRKQRSNNMNEYKNMDEYTVNTVKVSKMFLGFLIFAVSLNVDNTCDDQKQLPYWVYAISLHMGLLTLLDLIFTYVERFKKFRDEVRRTHKTMGSFLDHVRGFIHITFSIGLVPGAAWSYWTFGTCCTSAILSTILLLLVLWERTLLRLLNYVALLARIQEKREKLNKKRY